MEFEPEPFPVPFGKNGAARKRKKNHTTVGSGLLGTEPNMTNITHSRTPYPTKMRQQDLDYYSTINRTSGWTVGFDIPNSWCTLTLNPNFFNRCQRCAGEYPPIGWTLTDKSILVRRWQKSPHLIEPCTLVMVRICCLQATWLWQT